MKRQINAWDVIADIRAGKDDEALVRRYDISPRDLDNIVARLIDAKLLNQEDLAHRPARAITNKLNEMSDSEMAVHVRPVSTTKEARWWQRHIFKLAVLIAVCAILAVVVAKEITGAGRIERHIENQLNSYKQQAAEAQEALKRLDLEYQERKRSDPR